jgi:hypothetical protein
MESHLSPFRSFVHQQNQVANLLDFKSCARNASFSQKIMRVKEAGEIKTSARGVKAPGLIGKLLLLVDPIAVKRGLKLRDAGLAQRRPDVCAQSVKEVIKFQDASGRMLERRRDHALKMVSQDGRQSRAGSWPAKHEEAENRAKIEPK